MHIHQETNLLDLLNSQTWQTKFQPEVLTDLITLNFCIKKAL